MNVSANRCKIDEYYESVLEQCHPCSFICDPIESRKCKKECGDYIKSLQACPSDYYWDRTNEKCLPCTSICSPLNRTDCKKACSRYIKELEKTKDLPDSTIVLGVVVAVVSTILFLCIVVLVYCNRKRIAKLFRCLMRVQQEKLPTQETGTPGIGLIDPSQQPLVQTPHSDLPV